MNKLSLKNNPAQALATFVACRDSILRVESISRDLGIDPASILILSRRDNPQLRTIDDIVASLPETVTLLGLDDVEQLLPDGERTLRHIQALLQGASLRYAHRGLRIVATMTIPDATEPALFTMRRAR